MARAKRPQVHVSGEGIVNQHCSIMRTNEFHAHETGFPVVITDMLLAISMSGVDGDAVRLDRLVVLDGSSQRVWWSTRGWSPSERCGKHQG